MTSSHRIALKTLLEGVRDCIAKKEADLLKTTDDDERSKLIEEIADLYVRKKELVEASGGFD